jgi:hypothetical protein
VTQETQNRRELLTELAKSNTTRSYTAQIRDLYDVIENALGSGVSRTVIHQKLVDSGMTLSLRNFDQALYRIRKSNKLSGQGKTAQPGKIHIEPVSKADSNKPALLSGERIKPQANFRESIKQIRAEVENTDWDKVIRDSKMKPKP